MKQIICHSCSKEFLSKKNCKNRVVKYCSKGCYYKSLQKNKICKSCGKEFYNYKNKYYCSKECSVKRLKGVSLLDEHKKALSIGRLNSEKCKGENLYNWKGGKSTEKERIKSSFYKRKYQLKLKFDSSFLKRLILSQKNQCFFCENDLSDYKAIEHLTPVSKGGDNQIYNLVYSCKSCNSKKRQNTLEEYAIKNNRFDWIDKFDEIYANAIS
jgi:hypothetical protein